MSAPAALLVTSSFLPGRGGIESYLARLCDELAPALAVLAPARRDRAALPSDLPYATVGHPGRMLVPGRRTAGAIVAAARDLACDRVLFGTPWPVALTGPAVGRAGLRYAVIIHGAELTVPAALPGIRTALGRALAGADLLLPVSRYTEDAARALLARAALAVPEIEVLRARVDLDRFRPGVPTGDLRRRLRLAPHDRVVLCFGRLVPRKGVDRLLAAVARLARPEVVAVVAGTGPEKGKLERLAARLGIRVRFAGRVPEGDAPAMYALADVFALAVADRWFGLEIEGLGVVLLEAAAAGVPCVTGRSGGTDEAVVDGVTGYVVNGRDPAALADRIAALLDDPERARAMGAAGRAHVSERFNGARPDSLHRWLGVR